MNVDVWVSDVGVVGTQIALYGRDVAGRRTAIFVRDVPHEIYARVDIGFSEADLEVARERLDADLRRSENREHCTRAACEAAFERRVVGATLERRFDLIGHAKAMQPYARFVLSAAHLAHTAKYALPRVVRGVMPASLDPMHGDAYEDCSEPVESFMRLKNFEPFCWWTAKACVSLREVDRVEVGPVAPGAVRDFLQRTGSEAGARAPRDAIQP